jgi:peptide chain release factor subunit 3
MPMQQPGMDEMGGMGMGMGMGGMMNPMMAMQMDPYAFALPYGKDFFLVNSYNRDESGNQALTVEQWTFLQTYHSNMFNNGQCLHQIQDYINTLVFYYNYVNEKELMMYQMQNFPMMGMGMGMGGMGMGMGGMGMGGMMDFDSMYGEGPRRGLGEDGEIPKPFIKRTRKERRNKTNKDGSKRTDHQQQQQNQIKKDKKKKVKKTTEKKKRIPKEEKDVDVENYELVDVDETRQPASLVFIGHVDAGKSTICGGLMYYSGMVDERTIKKYKEEAKEKNRDSWWLAYVMDVNEDEKAKGKTVEVGRATMETETKRYTIFDAPGHKNYVPNMISGAAMADFGGLVISARKGEFEAGFEKEGQTREHAQLAKSLGVQKLIVIVNKMDEPSVKWKKERYDEIIKGLNPFLLECGYLPEDVLYVPISGLTGDNMVDELKTTVCSWYKGPTLMQVLDQVELPYRNEKAPLRIPVFDRMKDRGIVCFGKVEAGTLEMGQKLTLMPNGYPAQVTYIFNCKDQAVKYAKPGENIKIKIRSIEDENYIAKGDVFCNRDENLVPTSEFIKAEIDIL